MNLKQRALAILALNVVGLLTLYGIFSRFYIFEHEQRLRTEKIQAVESISEGFEGFFARGIEKLNSIGELPGLRYGLQSLATVPQGVQAPFWTTLHYLFFQSDIFTSGVALVDIQGRVLWSEPPDTDLLGTLYASPDSVNQALAPGDLATSSYTWWVGERSQELLIVRPLADGDGSRVGALIGAIPFDHPEIQAILRRSPADKGTGQLVDSAGRVVASTDPARQLQTLRYWQQSPSKTTLNIVNGDFVAVTPVRSSPLTVTIDQNATVAFAPIERLQTSVTQLHFGFTVLLMGALAFSFRYFTRPIEALTHAASRIAAGDLTHHFALPRGDEIGVLSRTLDDMRTKLSASYELLLRSEKMSMMGQVVAGIAHELNNPLTIVIGNVQLMMLQEKNEKTVQWLSRVQGGAERASQIVKNLLIFARQKAPERRLIDINSVITKTLDLRLYELRINNIEVSVDLDPSLPETMADPHQLQQVFLNLLVNAENAMSEAHGKGLLRIKSQQEDGHLQILFSDNGPGISNENIRRVFDPFFTTKPVGKGTGLGLSICQGIIAEHGGSIDLDNTVGRGCTFAVTIPIQQRERSAAVAAAPERTVTPTRKKILVVQEEPQIRQLFIDVLTGEGYDVYTAANGTLALELIDQTPYDLIISDVRMEELSGADLYALSKRKRVGLEHRFLFVTGDVLDPDTLQFVKSPGRNWLQKPFDVASLTNAVAELLQ